MEYQTRIEPGITIIDLKGEVDVSHAPKLRKMLVDFFDIEARDLLLNMKNVTYIDSAGLSVLIAAHRKAQEKRFSFGLANLQQSVRQVFHITGMTKVMQTFSSVEEGVSAFSKR